MTTRMTATDLAMQFAERGLAGRWLSAKQTSFLRDLASSPSVKVRDGVAYDAMRHTYHGGWRTEAGDIHSWSLYISPINRCGLFNVTVYTQARFRLEDEKSRLEDALRAINERAMACITANDPEGVRAVYGDPENRKVMERFAEVEALLKEGV